MMFRVRSGMVGRGGGTSRETRAYATMQLMPAASSAPAQPVLGLRGAPRPAPRHALLGPATPSRCAPTTPFTAGTSAMLGARACTAPSAASPALPTGSKFEGAAVRLGRLQRNLATEADGAAAAAEAKRLGRERRRWRPQQRRAAGGTSFSGFRSSTSSSANSSSRRLLTDGTCT